MRAKQIVTAAEEPPSSNLYQQLAALAYQAGDNRVGDLAATRAIDLAPASERKALRTALDRSSSRSPPAARARRDGGAEQVATTAPSG